MKYEVTSILLLHAITFYIKHLFYSTFDQYIFQSVLLQLSIAGQAIVWSKVTFCQHLFLVADRPRQPYIESLYSYIFA